MPSLVAQLGDNGGSNDDRDTGNWDFADERARAGERDGAEGSCQFYCGSRVMPGWFGRSWLGAGVGGEEGKRELGGMESGPFVLAVHEHVTADDVPTEKSIAPVVGGFRYRQSVKARRLEERWLSQQRGAEKEEGLVWEVVMEDGAKADGRLTGLAGRGFGSALCSGSW